MVFNTAFKNCGFEMWQNDTQAGINADRVCVYEDRTRCKDGSSDTRGDVCNHIQGSKEKPTYSAFTQLL